MDSSLSDFLSAGEIRDLALCGITTPDQLKKVKAETLWQDLQKAQEFFPDHQLTLTVERLSAVCGEVVSAAPAAKSAQHISSWDKLNVKNRGQVLAKMKYPHQLEEAEEEEAVEESFSTAERDIHAGIPMKKAKHVSGLSKGFHAVHCTHPWLVYIGAFTTVLLIPALCCLGVVPRILLQGAEAEPQHLVYAAAACCALLLPYFIYSRIAKCSVCHMPIFSFRNYGRNRAAHHLPILGYTIPTALHILLFFQFRCPACGTTQKLFARRRSHRH